MYSLVSSLIWESISLYLICLLERDDAFPTAKMMTQFKGPDSMLHFPWGCLWVSPRDVFWNSVMSKCIQSQFILRLWHMERGLPPPCHFPFLKCPWELLLAPFGRIVCRPSVHVEPLIGQTVAPWDCFRSGKWHRGRSKLPFPYALRSQSEPSPPAPGKHETPLLSSQTMDVPRENVTCR